MTVRGSLYFIVGSLALAAGLVSCTRKGAPASDGAPNTFHNAQVAKIKSLDPAQCDDVYSPLEAGRSYEGLLQYHYLKRPFALMPNLAEAMPEVKDGGKTYTFKIKKGVLFQDDPAFKQSDGKGRELTANDFVYAIKRVADPKANASTWWLFDGKIAGLNEWREASAKANASDFDRKVEGLYAEDRYTLVVKLTRPSHQILFAFAMPASFAVAREVVETYGAEFGWHPVGTGPYRMESHEGQSKFVWVRNPTFRRELYPAESEGDASDRAEGFLRDAGKPLPFIDRVITTVYEEAQPRWLNLMAGNTDIGDIPKDLFPEVVGADRELTAAYAAKKFKLNKTVRLDFTRFTFNLRDPLFKNNKLLRQAMSLAYDSDEYINLFYNGRGVAAQGPIPPGLAGYEADFRNPYRQFNLARAKELLAKAGYPEGRGLAPIQFLSLADSVNRQDAEYFERSMARIGIKIRTEAYTWPEFSARVRDGRGQLWAQAWQADYPDAENFLQLYLSRNVAPGPNDSAYHNPEYDALYESSLKLADGAERTAIYRKMVRLLTEDCPSIFVAHRVVYSLAQPWLKNFKPHELDAGRHKYLRLEKTP